jgi:hypothetical protein
VARTCSWGVLLPPRSERPGGSSTGETTAQGVVPQLLTVTSVEVRGSSDDFASALGAVPPGGWPQPAPYGGYQGAPPQGGYPQPFGQQYGQPYGGYPYAPPRTTNGFAIASMVLGILWLYWFGSILALVFGYVAQSQIRERGEAGGGMATAGIVLGWIGVGFLALFVAFGLAASV